MTSDDMRTVETAVPAAVARIGPHELMSAFDLIKQGRLFDLATDIGRDMPHGSRDTFAPFRLTQYRRPKSLLHMSDPPASDWAMEQISGSPHLGTHMDGLTHAQSHAKVFGGLPLTEVYDDTGWKAHGMETVQPIIGRGVLLDVARSQSVKKLPDLFEITPGHLEHCLGSQGTDLSSVPVRGVRPRRGELRAGSPPFTEAGEVATAGAKRPM